MEKYKFFNAQLVGNEAICQIEKYIINLAKLAVPGTTKVMWL